MTRPPERRRGPVLVVRVERCPPGFTAGEPAEFTARCVEPEFVSVGRGLSAGQALDRLLGCLPRSAPPRVSAIVDPAARGA